MNGFVALNADLGEEVTDDDALLSVVTSANVACGYHAGNREIMRTVCARAAGPGVSVGAQVSYDDRTNFGRVARDVPPDLLRDQVGTRAPRSPPTPSSSRARSTRSAATATTPARSATPAPHGRR